MSEQSIYRTKELSDAAVNALAFEIVKKLDGLPIGHARFVLRQAESWIDATVAVDCSATEFQRAVSGCSVAAEQSA